VGYNLYYRSTPAGTPTLVNTTGLITSTSAVVNANGQTLYYTVRAVESNGYTSVESADSYIVSTDVSRDLIITFPDTVSTLVVPAAVSYLLDGSLNGSGVDLKIVVTDLMNQYQNDPTVIQDFQIDVVRADNGALVNSQFPFGIPVCTLNLAYDLTGKVSSSIASNPLYSRAINSHASYVASNHYAVFYNQNGSGNWVDENATDNALDGIISVKISTLGEYQIRNQAGNQISSSGSASITVSPQVITPNGDGINDVVNFVLNNPNNSSVTGTIYNRKGRFVANLTGSGGIGNLSWDGKDSNGVVVPMGLYVYIIQGDSFKFKGVVAVAR
jgi:gliding motility-associated-like protein